MRHRNSMIALGIGAVFSVLHSGPISVDIPTKDQVGADKMPDEIAPVKAPFPMPAFKKPTFPDHSVSIADHGAKPNILSTKAIQDAIDAVSGIGGGQVVVPAGQWLSGRISLKSTVNLHISEGATLSFSGNIEDFQPPVFTRSAGFEVMSTGALIYANGQNNIALTGKGKLIGPPDGSPVSKQSIEYGSLDDVVKAQYKTPVEQRVYDGKQNGGKIFLPAFISPINCTNVYIEGVTLEKTAFWNIVPEYCDTVIIRGVTVNSVGIPMGDGIDVESSRNVLIEYSTLNNGDDCFTMKAGRNEDGIRVDIPTENIVVRYCLAKTGHGGITLGSEVAGWVRNLYLQDCVFDGTGIGIRFKTRRPRGGGGENIFMERIRMNLTGKVIRADMLGTANYVGDLAKRLPVRAINDLTPQFKNFYIKDIIVEKSSGFVHNTGIPESPFLNLRVENAVVKCDQLFDISDTENFHLKNAVVESPDANINLLGTRNVKFDSVTFKVPGNDIKVSVKDGSSDPAEIQTRNIRFVNCTPQKPSAWKETTYKSTEDFIVTRIRRKGNRNQAILPVDGNFTFIDLKGRVPRKSASPSFYRFYVDNRGHSNGTTPMLP